MALVCRMTKKLLVTGNTVIMESSLCVFMRLVGMYEIGVYGN